MEDLFSDRPDTSKYVSPGSEASTIPLLSDGPLTEEAESRSKARKIALGVLPQTSWFKGPHSTYRVSAPEEDNDCVSLTFPRKLWKIVESDKFKSIWWSEDGTSVVINEDQFKEEILGRKYPFKIFETNSMKSLVRQLNLYGFRKIQHRLERSASLVEFLAEEKEVYALAKLLCYHNPNFKQGCPQLLRRMKRRLRIKNVSPAAASLVPQVDNQQHPGAENKANNSNSDLLAENGVECFLSTSGNLKVSPTSQPSSRHMVPSSTDLVRNVFPLTSSLVGPPAHIITQQHAILNHLTSVHRLSNNSYTQAKGQIVNCVTMSTCQYRIIPPFQNGNFGLVMAPSAIPSGYPHLLAKDTLVSNLLWSAHHQPLSISTILNTSAEAFSNSTHQIISSNQHHANNN